MGNYDDFSSPYSASDTYYDAGGQQPSSYMNAGPAFDMGNGGGSFGALSGQGQGMGMGMGGMQQPQPDPGLTSMQYGMGQQQPAYAPEIQPSGGGSWFKRLLSSTVLGMAAGAGQQDPATAFSAGYAAVAQQKEMERQQIAMQKKQQQEQEMWEINRASKLADIVKTQKETQNIDVDNKRELDKSLNEMQRQVEKDGYKYESKMPATEENLAKIGELTNRQPWLYDHFELNGELYLYKADPSRVTNSRIGFSLPNPTNPKQPGIEKYWEPGTPMDTVMDERNKLIDSWQKSVMEQQRNSISQQQLGVSQGNLKLDQSQFDWTKTHPTGSQNDNKGINSTMTQVGYAIKNAQDIIQAYNSALRPADRVAMEQDYQAAKTQLPNLQAQMNSLLQQQGGQPVTGTGVGSTYTPPQARSGAPTVDFGSVGGSGQGTASGSMPVVHNAAEYAAIPSGTQYKDANGNVRTKR